MCSFRRVFTLMDMTWSIMEIASIAAAGLIADTIGIVPVYYLGGGLLIAAGLLGLALLGRYRRAVVLST